MANIIGPLPLASLNPQSPYSGVHLRVSDIFPGLSVVLYILVEPALHDIAR